MTSRLCIICSWRTDGSRPRPAYSTGEPPAAKPTMRLPRVMMSSRLQLFDAVFRSGPDQPSDRTRPPAAPLAFATPVAARDVTPAVVPGHSFRIVARGADTSGAYSVTEATSPLGAGVPVHAHDGTVECFYVLGGRYRFTVSGRTDEVGAGGFALIPRGASHRFEVADGEARAVVLFVPAGFEEVFRRMPAIFGTPASPAPCGSRPTPRRAPAC